MNTGALRSPLPLLSLRNRVLLPDVVVSVPLGRPQSVALADAVHAGDLIVVATQNDESNEQPQLADLLPVAVVAEVLERASGGKGRYRLVLRGRARCRLVGLSQTQPFIIADVEALAEPMSDANASRVLTELLLDQLRQAGLSINEHLQQLLAQQDLVQSPGRAADLAAAALGLDVELEKEILLTLDIEARLRRVHALLAEAKTLSELRDKIGREVGAELNSRQREAILRQQLAAIKRELGEGDDEGKGEVDGLRERLAKAELPDEARSVAKRELGRLEKMQSSQPEYHVIRNYLELILDLPWSKRAEVKHDLAAARTQLDNDHFGLDEVKRRLLEHLAVRQLGGNERGTVLCLSGPPGVGKTSLGKSLADATGRPLARVSLGGMRDEAEIRGHRRTYIGALPGRILHAIRQAGVKNPLIVLDEIDKLGQGVWGSPEAALLEVLDPEQNHTFTDNYLEIAFDLSEVMFVCTANSLEGVLQPLRDRLEVIEIDGYTQDEKLAIAKRHLLPKALKRHNLPEDALLLDDSAVASVIADYTREAGVRELERQLTKLCRRLAFDTVSKGAVAHGDGTVAVDGTTKLDGEALHAWLGKAKFFNEMAERTAVPGVAIGMAWTPVGGDILFVEASRMRGKGKLEITGQLGDVMQESARAALTHLRSKAGELGLDPMVFGETDVHIHVPAGAVPKDGPSAGITMFAALASIMLDRRVRSDTAMTGECTLRGRVLPVGGIKAKLLAAHRAGIKRVVLPKKNERDVDDVPKEIQDELTLVYVDAMQAVLDAVLEPAGTWTAARDTALPSGEPQHVAH